MKHFTKNCVPDTTTVKIVRNLLISKSFEVDVSKKRDGGPAHISVPPSGDKISPGCFSRSCEWLGTVPRLVDTADVCSSLANSADASSDTEYGDIEHNHSVF